MVSEMFLEIWRHVKSLKPSFVSKKPHFNFITVHYFWIIGMAIVGSIMVYPAGNMPYIDALFFASGSATQSGLNTIDLNKINTYQQVILILLPMLTNPMTINTFVVFLRLYWFEKRFQNIAKEAKQRRRTISKSRSQMRDDQDVGKAELGVNGRSIFVMHDTTRANGPHAPTEGVDLDGIHTQKPKTSQEDIAVGSSKASGSSQEEELTRRRSEPEMIIHHPRTINFAEEVKRSNAYEEEPVRSPLHWTEADHIAVLERQRNPLDKGVLRIPGPRDMERGFSPETVDEDDEIQQVNSRSNSAHYHRDSNAEPVQAINSDEEPAPNEGPRRGITITEPAEHPRTETEANVRAAVHTFDVLKPHRFISSSRTKSQNHDTPGTASKSKTLGSFRTVFSTQKEDLMPYLSWQATVGRNSAFVDLSEDQREELGGIEYRSLKSLALILTLYFWGFFIFGIVCLTPWIVYSKTYGEIVDNDGQNKIWWGIFTSTSAFTDLGFTLTPDSMISFGTAIWPLLSMSFLIIIGNTGFPVMLRFIIWVTSIYVPTGSGFWEELKFLLDHPRRCFTLLFPSQATWWLFWILVILNGLDLLFFIILDLGNTIVTELPLNIRLLDGWFQAVSTRTAGFDCVNLAALHPAIQVSYLLMMYISVLPIAISVRRTNVYEEKSLGIYGSSTEEEEDSAEPSYVGAHLRRQLSFDLWYIFLGLFVISISEGGRIQSGDKNFTMFSILFEVVSAYGTVGLSLGYPTVNASFSSQFGVIAKLVIIAMQIRGRHRGLPYELDRAILLPSESLHEKENSLQAPLRRRGSSATVNGVSTGVNLDQMNSGQTEGVGARNGRSRSRGRDQGNFLSSLLHPGPTIPNMHRRDIYKIESNYEAKHGGVEATFGPTPGVPRRRATMATPSEGMFGRDFATEGEREKDDIGKVSSA